ncbi:hypothetical protein GRF29_154g366386 [Pseudopithomyces chartarum]|jgi:hypothetical protein|uniref:Uncharacterized protein n=1 Tax=Pseudopithomyces chartarum TaxID=1892770 RepID=A0AAN6LQP9_9PLEO|nr:hypothetical protein GRF29_154g366386 [Pseudopithomyces chartarum]
MSSPEYGLIGPHLKHFAKWAASTGHDYRKPGNNGTDGISGLPTQSLMQSHQAAPTSNLFLARNVTSAAMATTNSPPAGNSGPRLIWGVPRHTTTR